MARYAYERLSAQDASFLWAENGSQAMHIGGLAIVEAEPLRRGGEAIDIDAFRRGVEAVLHWIPRYRQKLAWTPIEGWPVWVDDRQFDLGYHIRHIALPRPGSRAQLKEIAARINARTLDRDRPLWEIWVIEGVEDGEQVAVLNKIHHCMIDGAAGADISQILMSPSPKHESAEPVPYMPRPAPTGAELLRDSVSSWLGAPFGLVSGAAAALTRETSTDAASPGAGPGIGPRLRAIADMAGYALRPASETPLNGDLSPHRRLEWLTMPLDDVREIRRVLGCTINDVVLATVCGAMRRFLFRRRVDGSRLDFRVAAPVSTRQEGDERRQGNHVSSWVVPLPLGEENPLEQLITLRAKTEELKRKQSALALDTLMQALEYLPPRLISLGVGLASGPANLMVTNVPGPQFPLYMVGARLLGLYPIVPLLPNTGLGIALFSYEGKLCWGFNGDYELVPDLGDFVNDIQAAFEQLRAATVSHFMERRTGVDVPIEEVSKSGANGAASAVRVQSVAELPAAPESTEGAVATSAAG